MLCLERITFANVYDIYLDLNMMTEVVLHGLGLAQQLLSIAVTLLTPMIEPLYYNSVIFTNFPTFLPYSRLTQRKPDPLVVVVDPAVVIAGSVSSPHTSSLSSSISFRLSLLILQLFSHHPCSSLSAFLL